MPPDSLEAEMFAEFARTTEVPYSQISTADDVALDACRQLVAARRLRASVTADTSHEDAERIAAQVRVMTSHACAMADYANELRARTPAPETPVAASEGAPPNDEHPLVWKDRPVAMRRYDDRKGQPRLAAVDQDFRKWYDADATERDLIGKTRTRVLVTDEVTHETADLIAKCDVELRAKLERDQFVAPEAANPELFQPWFAEGSWFEPWNRAHGPMLWVAYTRVPGKYVIVRAEGCAPQSRYITPNDQARCAAFAKAGGRILLTEMPPLDVVCAEHRSGQHQYRYGGSWDLFITELTEAGKARKPATEQQLAKAREIRSCKCCQLPGRGRFELGTVKAELVGAGAAFVEAYGPALVMHRAATKLWREEFEAEHQRAATFAEQRKHGPAYPRLMPVGTVVRYDAVAHSFVVVDEQQAARDRARAIADGPQVYGSESRNSQNAADTQRLLHAQSISE